VATPFDTLAYTQKLRSTGVPPDQAEGHAEALKAALAETVATKGDVEAVRRDLKDVETALRTALTADIAAVRHDLQTIEAALRADMAGLDHKIEVSDERLRRQIAEAKTDITRWLVGIGLALFLALVTIAVRVWTT
jgi:Protein of unknown function (DUF1640)